MIRVYIYAWPEHYVGGGGRHDFMALCVRLLFDCSTIPGLAAVVVLDACSAHMVPDARCG